MLWPTKGRIMALPAKLLAPAPAGVVSLLLQTPARPPQTARVTTAMRPGARPANPCSLHRKTVLSPGFARMSRQQAAWKRTRRRCRDAEGAGSWDARADQRAASRAERSALAPGTLEMWSGTHAGVTRCPGRATTITTLQSCDDANRAGAQGRSEKRGGGPTTTTCPDLDSVGTNGVVREAEAAICRRRGTRGILVPASGSYAHVQHPRRLRAHNTVDQAPHSKSLGIWGPFQLRYLYIRNWVRDNLE